MKIQVVTSVLTANDAVAQANRERLEAAGLLVLNITSARGLFEAWRDAKADRSGDPLSWLIPGPEQAAPIVTVHDGAPHTLAWLGSVHGARLYPLGGDDFGQSGTRNDLYHHVGIDADAIVAAARRALARAAEAAG